VDRPKRKLVTGPTYVKNLFGKRKKEGQGEKEVGEFSFWGGAVKGGKNRGTKTAQKKGGTKPSEK